MTILESNGDGNVALGGLKQKSATLTDDERRSAEGKHEDLVDWIQKNTGGTREAVEKA